MTVISLAVLNWAMALIVTHLSKRGGGHENVVYESYYASVTATLVAVLPEFELPYTLAMILSMAVTLIHINYVVNPQKEEQ